MLGLSRRTAWGVIALVLLTTIPFLNKPFHIDDTVVLAASQNIIQNPLDPFASDFDWFGQLQPLWKVTTNPPVLSYYLAPFVSLFGYNEIALHAAMMLFVFMLGWGAALLSDRFCHGSVWPWLFILTSPAVVVSGNVMRDVPAVGLGTLGVALFILGVDRDRRWLLFGGAVLSGLAALTKYSSIITLPLLVMYPLFVNKPRHIVWIWPIIAILALWCLQNVVMYDAVHIIYLLSERRSEGGISWQDKLYGAFLVVGSCLFIFPAILVRAVWRRDWSMLLILCASTPLVYFAIESYLDDLAGFEYLFWALTGFAVILLLLLDSIRRGIAFLWEWAGEERRDSLFLFAWLCAPVLFSVLFVPFQAVRHLLPALPPLMLLSIRYLQRDSSPRFHQTLTILLSVLLIAQTVLAAAVQASDYEYANTYREFARQAERTWANDDRHVWFAGHWGWMFYAQEAGFSQLRRGGEAPREGDILIVPNRVDKGAALADNPDYLSHQDKIESVEYNGTLPVRSQNFWGAGFYGTISIWGRNIPYRLGQDVFLEIFDVYRIVDPAFNQPPADESTN
ncbi:MAG: hypothetical protein GC154_02765 [bacterium]|nr:hypothetical protein [bacterium]